MLATLKLQDEQILRMRFGIGKGDAMTLDEIGTKMGVTRERIRQIESKAIRHLKNPVRRAALLTELNGPDTPECPKYDEVEGGSSHDLVDEAQVKKLVEALTHKTPRKNLLKPSPIKVEIPTFDVEPNEPETHTNAVSVQVQKLLDEAITLGASVQFEPQGAGTSIWVDFSIAAMTPPRSLIRKLVYSGFSLWPGRGYWK
jgi:RNA polymerase primary sigma factor